VCLRYAISDKHPVARIERSEMRDGLDLLTLDTPRISMIFCFAFLVLTSGENVRVFVYGDELRPAKRSRALFISGL